MSKIKLEKIIDIISETIQEPKDKVNINLNLLIFQSGIVWASYNDD